MKLLKILVELERGGFAYISSNYNSCSETKFHFVNKFNVHIDTYWLFKINSGGLDLYFDVGTNAGKSSIDTGNYGKLIIIGVDEI